jgi:hypothetical protein
MEKATHIIEDTANRLWAVWATGDANLEHVYYGIEVKRAKGGFQPKAKARATLVRKAATHLVAMVN